MACRWANSWALRDALSATLGRPVDLVAEGSIRNPVGGGAWEYSMVLTIRNERGEEIARRLVGVGAMQPDEQRTFTLSVEMSPGGDKGAMKRGTRH